MGGNERADYVRRAPLFLKDKASVKYGIVTGWDHDRLVSPMSFSHFLRIEHDEQAGSKHYIVHTIDPRFSMELVPDPEAPDKVGKGVIKRICLPNSWTGDYGKCVDLIGSAQDFFAQTFTDPVPKAVTKRFAL